MLESLTSKSISVTTLPLYAVAEMPFRKSPYVDNLYVSLEEGLTAIGIASRNHLLCVKFLDDVFRLKSPPETVDTMLLPPAFLEEGLLPENAEIILTASLNSDGVIPAHLKKSAHIENTYFGLIEGHHHSLYTYGAMHYHFLLPIANLSTPYSPDHLATLDTLFQVVS